MIMNRQKAGKKRCLLDSWASTNGNTASLSLERGHRKQLATHRAKPPCPAAEGERNRQPGWGGEGGSHKNGQRRMVNLWLQGRVGSRQRGEARILPAHLPPLSVPPVRQTGSASRSSILGMRLSRGASVLLGELLTSDEEGTSLHSLRVARARRCGVNGL